MTNLGNKVLVLGSDSRSFLAVIRSLGRTGKNVHIAWHSRSSIAVHSKYVSQAHQLSRPPSETWANEFEDLLEREAYDLVIPCNDPSILPLHENRDRFAQYPVYLTDAKFFDTIMDKAAVNRVAAKCSLNLPRELAINSETEIALLDELQGPYVLKPTQSYTLTNLAKKNHVELEHDLETAKQKISRLLDSTPVTVQEYFSGCGVGVEFIASNGRILFAFQHRRLHEPPGGGGSSYRRSCALDPQLYQATEKLVDSLNYTGVGMMEYLYNLNTKEWIFVEFNSRFWGSLPLAIRCGADFPSFLYDLICKQRDDFPSSYLENRVARNWFLDLKWLRQTVATNGLNAGKQLLTALKLFCEMRYPLTLRESSDTLCFDDPSPGINEIRDFVSGIPVAISSKFFKFNLKRKSYLTRQSKRLRECIRTAKNVLFVCKGNICRSPFAHHYLLSTTGKFKVDSCGYFPRANRKSPTNAVTSAKQYGIELASHRSKVINNELVESADLIVVFDVENYLTVRREHPKSKKKVFLLGLSTAHSNQVVINDPFGGATSDFDDTYQAITHSLDSLVEFRG